MTSVIGTGYSSCEARKHYSEMLHNATLYAPVYGTAGCLEGIPFYCDGRHLLVTGYSLDKSNFELSSRIGRVIAKLLARMAQEIRSIEFWGPVPPHLTDGLDEFEVTTSREPDDANCDVFLPLAGLTSRRVRDRRDVRRAIRNGLATCINSSKELSHSHAALVELFLQRHSNFGDDEQRYFACWQKVLQDPDSELIEVHREGELTGFAVVNCFGEHAATYAYGFFDNSIAGTSDLAHCAMIEYCLSRGLKELDLGYSIHASLLRYKMKWGKTRRIPPPWSVCWRYRR